MIDLRVSELSEGEFAQFKRDMQYAFRKGAEDGMGESGEVLPEKDIDRSLAAKGAAAYKAEADGEMVGGAIVVVDEETQHNHLDFLYVRHGIQGKGIGQMLWKQIELLYPKTKVWETCTPYFDQRNIHFYINRLGFHAVEFFNKHHPDKNFPGDNYDEFGGMFRFLKVMR